MRGFVRKAADKSPRGNGPPYSLLRDYFSIRRSDAIRKIELRQDCSHLLPKGEGVISVCGDSTVHTRVESFVISDPTNFVLFLDGQVDFEGVIVPV